MLAHLSIRDIVLIERLDIDFSAGLSVLTGETGAGKSILLDALSLSLGLQRILRRPIERSFTSRMSPSSAALCLSTEMRTVCNSRNAGPQTKSVPRIQS